MRKTMVYIKKENNMDNKINEIEKINLQNDEDLVLLENYISTLPLNKELLIALFNLLEDIQILILESLEELYILWKDMKITSMLLCYLIL